MSKLFLSGRISDGKDNPTNKEIQLARLKFFEIQLKLEDLGCEVVNPFNVKPILGTDWQGYMRATIIELMKCDYIYSIPGWEDSRGARIERAVCDMMGIPVWRGDVE